MSPRSLLAFCLLGGIAHAQSASSSSDAALAKSVALPAGPLGQGAWRFEVDPGWAKVPAGVTLGPTHGGVAVDKAGNIYVSSDGPNGILVFDKSGKYLRGLTQELSGIHGLLIRQEGNKEYIYGARAGAGQAVKASLDGKLEWTIDVPKQSGFYDQPADEKKKPTPFKPTGIAIGPDNRIYIADGYGASVIHMYSADRKYLKTIGTKGEGEGQFKTCHGIALDTRYGTPRLLVADRENKRLVHLDLDGKWLGVLASDLRRPCSISFRGDYAAIAELQGRVVITDKAGKIVSTLGDNPDQKQWAAFKLEPEFWRDGIFIAPHGLSFDKDGNLFVQDWNFTGRFTKLKKVGGKSS
jgi:sugar lactone lactonase YvrE